MCHQKPFQREVTNDLLIRGAHCAPSILGKVTISQISTFVNIYILLPHQKFRLNLWNHELLWMVSIWSGICCAQFHQNPLVLFVTESWYIKIKQSWLSLDAYPFHADMEFTLTLTHFVFPCTKDFPSLFKFKKRNLAYLCGLWYKTCNTDLWLRLECSQIGGLMICMVGKSNSWVIKFDVKWRKILGWAE